MRLYPLTAALLLGGTCALAGAPSAPPMGEAISEAAARLYAHMAQHQNAGNPDLDLAVNPQASDTSSVGVGGPYEPVDEPAPAATTLAAADLTPRPATQNYPPCDPGPGDDSCIQLYEPGVRTALASWQRPTGGLIDSAAPATAMGGPYEPVQSTSETAMNRAGKVGGALGDIAANEIVHFMTSGPEAQHTGMGGPDEPVEGAFEAGYVGDGTIDHALGETEADEVAHATAAAT